ncbi:S8 family peptidase [Haladaptatus sp. NG-SE-30]
MTTHNRRSFLKLSGTLLGGLAVGSTVTAAVRTDRFIVDTRGISTKTLERNDLTVVHDLDAINVAVVEGAKRDVPSLRTTTAPDISYKLDFPVEEAPITEASEATDEPLYSLQWDKQVQEIPAVHEYTRGEGARVAIVDSGVYADHPDLQHAVNTDLSRDFTGDGYGAGLPIGGYHGTHVAGIVAANDQNDEGIVGTAPGAEVIDCRVFSTGPYADFGDMLAALVYSAENDCVAANMSIGAYPVPRNELKSFYGKVLNRTVTYTNSQGTLLVVSAGNDAADLQHDGRICVENDDGEVECFPAISLPNEAAQAMSISATGPIGFEWGEEGLREGFESPAFYTNYGTNAVDLGAPGGDADLDAIGSGVGWYLNLVLSTVAEPVFDDDGNYLDAEEGYGWAAGTSMAAPQVTGAVALVASLDDGPRSSRAGRLENVLEQTAEVPKDWGKEYYGHGFLNPLAAVMSMQ